MSVFFISLILMLNLMRKMAGGDIHSQPSVNRIYEIETISLIIQPKVNSSILTHDYVFNKRRADSIWARCRPESTLSGILDCSATMAGLFLKSLKCTEITFHFNCQFIIFDTYLNFRRQKLFWRLIIIIV